jgi:Fe-S cluster biogenesis protein NfuA
MPEERNFDQRVQGIETLIRKLDSAGDPATRALARELVQSVMDLHGAGLGRILELIYEQGDAGLKMIDALGDDRLTGSVLLLYGLHPVDLETRVRRALEKASAVVHAHGGSIELLSVTDGVVSLRLHGVKDRAAAAAVKAAIDNEIYAAAPDAVAVHGLEAIAGPDFIPLVQLAASSAAAESRP